MKWLVLARMSLRRILRDRVTLFFTLLFPAMFVVVFGLAFGGGSGPQQTYHVAVIDEDRPVVLGTPGAAAPETLALGRQLAQLLGSFAYGPTGELTAEPGGGGARRRRPVFDVITTLSAERALSRVRHDSIEAALVIPAGFTSALAAAGGPASVPRSSADTVVLYTDPANPDARIAGSLLRGILERYEERAAGIARARAAVARGEAVIEEPRRPVAIEQRPLSGERRTGFDWILPGLLVFALLGVQTGIAVELSRDVEHGLLDRLRVTRMGPIDYNLGRLLPWLVMAVVQTLFLIGVATVLGYHLHGSLALAVFLSVLTAIATFASAYLIAAFARNERQASSLSTFISIPLSFYVGAFFPFSQGPTVRLAGHAIGFRDLLPWSHMVVALRRVMLDRARLGQVAWHLEWFAGTTAVLVTIAIVVFNRRRLRHD